MLRKDSSQPNPLLGVAWHAPVAKFLSAKLYARASAMSKTRVSVSPEPTVTVTVWMGLPILFPDQLQGHMFVVLQLAVDVGKFGNRVRRPRDSDRTMAKQRLLQLDVVPVGYLRPTLSRRFRCFEILVNCTLRDRQLPAISRCFRIRFWVSTHSLANIPLWAISWKTVPQPLLHPVR
jgi:hypothetical protein